MAYTERNNLTIRPHIGRMRRLCLAFSKKIDHHRAAVALNYVHYNFCLICKSLRVTPAMAAGVTDKLWTVEDLLDALIAEPAGEKPTAKPLRHRTPDPARELPNGRGFLRVISGGKGSAPAPMPDAPTPPPWLRRCHPSMGRPLRRSHRGSSRFWTGDRSRANRFSSPCSGSTSSRQRTVSRLEERLV
jgi:hypothetical protein